MAVYMDFLDNITFLRNEDKEYLIPNVEAFVKTLTKDKIEINLIKGLIE